MKAASTLLACAVLLGLSAGSAPAQDGTAARRSFGNGVLSEHLAMYDLDNSGSLEEEEMEALMADKENRTRNKTLRDRWDANGDGRISLQERNAAKVQIRQAIIDRRNERFDEVDLDQNDILSWEEFQQIGAVAATITTNNDLVDDSHARKIFDHLNQDNQPGISRDEFLRSLDAMRPTTVPAPHPKPHENLTPPPGGN